MPNENICPNCRSVLNTEQIIALNAGQRLWWTLGLTLGSLASVLGASIGLYFAIGA